MPVPKVAQPGPSATNDSLPQDREPAARVTPPCPPAPEAAVRRKDSAWLSFRHALANLLRQNGMDGKVARELLRDTNSRVTLDIYQQSVTEERRAAQTLVFNGLLRGSNPQHPKTP